MILSYGNYSGRPGWNVDETKSTGYSRVYFPWSGQAEYQDSWGKTPLEPLHVYLLPTATAYSLTQDESDPFTCTFFHYDFFPGNFKRIIKIDLTRHRVLKNIRNSLQECMKPKDFPVLSALINAFNIYCRESGLIHFTTDQMTPILEYIGANITGDLSLEVLSHRAGYNEQYFIRLFKEKLGVTPHQYIISYRLKEARKLLDAEKTVTETAYKTGFSDVKSFSRCFKKNMGISPSDYKSYSFLKP